MDLSRKQRAVVASLGMVIATLLNLAFVYHGEARSGLGFQLCSALVLSGWVFFRGEDHDEDEW
jgi:hypothetical protein